jgi:putative endonuclease
MSRAKITLGQRGEELAGEKLAALGYALVARNYRCAHGEIDLIAQQGETWVFVEVRTRRGQQFGSPEESITARKQAHLIAAAQHYLQEHHLPDENWRIDVVAVELTSTGRLLRVDVLENAVTG